MKRQVRLLLLCGLLMSLVALTANARLISADQHIKQADQLRSAKFDAQFAPQETDGTRQSAGLPTGAARLDVVESTGKLLAQSYQEWQGFINAGNHVAFNPPVSPAGKAAVHFAYTARAAAATAGYARWAYTAYDASNGTIPVNKVIVQENGPSSIQTGGYPSIVIDPVNGKAIIVGHNQFSRDDSSTVRIQTSYDIGPLQGSFGSMAGGSVISDSLMMAQSWTTYQDRQVLPQSAMKCTATDTILYVATRGYFPKNPADANDGTFAMKVFKKVGKHRPTTNPDPEWQLVFVDSAFNASQSIQVDPTSDRVAVTWCKLSPNDFSGNQIMDVWYADSYDKGVTWTRHNVTNVTTSSLYIPWIIATSVFDSEGKLHIIYPGTYNPDGQTFGSILVKLVHWSEQDPTNTWVVYDASWSLNGSCGRIGSNVANVGRLAMAECEGRLYITFSANDPTLGPADDCCLHASDFRYQGNAEVYLTVSKDLIGKAWDRPRNLSNSYTPNCDTGTCADDQHSSLTTYGMDDADFTGTENWTNAVTVDPSGGYTGSHYLHLTYCTDRHPGRAATTGQGPWTLNDIRWIRLACTPPVVAAVLKPTPDSISFPEYTRPGVAKSYKIVLENTGNSDLTMQSITAVEDSARGASTPTGWMSAIGGPAQILETGKDSMTLTLNAGGIVTAGPTVLFGKLRFIYGPPTDTVDLPIQFTVADTVTYTTWDTLATACLRLAVGTDGNVGHNYGDSNGTSVGQANMDYYSNALGSSNYECDRNDSTSRGDATIYLGDGSPIIVRKSGSKLIGSWSAFAGGQPGTNFATANGFKPMTGSGYAPHGFTAGAKYDQFTSGTFVTVDSLVKVERTWYAPKQSDSCNFIVERTRVFPANIGSSISGLLVGEMIDWDVPSDTGASANSLSGNIGGYDATRKLLYQRGYDITGDSLAGVECAYNSRRYAGLALLSWNMKAGVCFDTLYGGSVIQNSVWQANSTNVLSCDTLYKYLHSNTVSVAPTTTPVDLSTFMTFKDGTSGWTLPANDTLTVYTALATVRTAASTNAGLDSLKLAIDKAKAFFHITLGQCMDCCHGTRGNVNGTGIVDLSDLSALVSYLTGGGYVLPCVNSANVNGVGIVDLSDLSALVSYLTGGGYVLPACGG